MRCGNDVCLQPKVCINNKCVTNPNPPVECGKEKCKPFQICINQICQNPGVVCGKERCLEEQICINQVCQNPGPVCGKKKCLPTQICINHVCQCREGETFSDLHQKCGTDCSGQACFRPKQCFRGEREKPNPKPTCFLYGKLKI